jgi:hypothetical protein
VHEDGRVPGWFRQHVLAIAAYLVAGVALFAIFLRLAEANVVISDMANVILMAQDMLHGNVLLHGWYTSDVSFYTTELPQYALIQAFLGAREEVTHIAAAMSYTLAVLFTVLLARGGVTGRRALIRTLIAAGIMLPGQFNMPVLGTIGHLGTSVPLLLVWVVLDRGGRRWWVPPVVSVLLAWVLVADRLTLVIAVGPLALVALVAVLRGLARHEVRRFELALVAAAVVAVGLAEAAEAVLRALGGYVLHSLPTQFLPLDQMRHSMIGTLQQMTGLFAAGIWGPRGIEFWFTALHLVSIALLLVATVIAVVSLFVSRLGDRVTLVDQVLAVACLAIVLSYGLTNASENGSHEMAPIVPFGAALTARVLVARARTGTGSREWRLPGVSRRNAAVAGWVAGCLVLAGYLGGVGYAARQPASKPQFAQFASWLSAHHLKDGLGGYWVSSIVTLESGGQVAVRALNTNALTPYWWMAKDTWYDPASAQANFLVLDTEPGLTTSWTQQQIDAKFGKPAHVYHTEGTITVLVWNHNLLKNLSS